MDKEKLKIALVIKTDGLEYDDRVRKEILSVQKLYPNIRFKIFVMFHENKVIEDVTSYGVPYKSIYIPARDKYPSATHTTLKAWQFYKVVKEEVKDFDAVWCACVETGFIAMLLSKRKILWDLHELPATFLSNKVMRILLKYIFGRCKVILHTNPQRIQYLQQLGVVKEPLKHLYLRNYPNFDDVDKIYDSTYQNFVIWKGERKCVYLQSLGSNARAAYESACAVLRENNLCAVIVGNFDKEAEKRLRDEYADFDERIYLAGKVLQLKIPQYIQQCYMSLIFYKKINSGEGIENNWYCEANRFYQAVIMGLPVVVGANPTMKEFVDKYQFGVAIDDDGSDINKISDGIHEVLKNYEFYHQNNIKYRDHLLWRQQASQIKLIVDKLLSK